jgi:hypothetical protein
MTDAPSIIPPQGSTPSAHAIPQALHDSEINFKIESFYDGIWTATLGDQMNGWGDHSRRPITSMRCSTSRTWQSSAIRKVRSRGRIVACASQKIRQKNWLRNPAFLSNDKDRRITTCFSLPMHVMWEVWALVFVLLIQAQSPKLRHTPDAIALDLSIFRHCDPAFISLLSAPLAKGLG